MYMCMKHLSHSQPAEEFLKLLDGSFSAASTTPPVAGAGGWLMQSPASGRDNLIQNANSIVRSNWMPQQI